MNGPGVLRSRTNVQVPADLNENTYKDIGTPNVYNISIARLQATAPLNITSFLGAVPNQLLRLIVEGPSAITLVNASGGIGQIKTSSGANVVLATGRTYTYSYDSENEWWSEETVNTASSVTGTLTPGTYLTGPSYNGSTNVTWAVDGTVLPTANKVAVRDASGVLFASAMNTGLVDFPTTITLGSVAGVIVTNNLQVNGNLTTAGNATLGNASTDTITTNGRLNSNFSPLTDVSIELGTTVLRFSNVYTRRVYSGNTTLQLYSAWTGSNGGVLLYTGTNGIDFVSGTPTSGSIILRVLTRSLEFRTGLTVNTTGAYDIATTLYRFRDAWFSRTVTALTFVGTLSGNAATASAWQTPRTITIGGTGKSVDGSANVSWSLAEIGAPPTLEFADIVWGTPGAESGNAIEVAATVYDLNGNVYATGEVSAVIVVSDSAASCEPSATATITAATVPVGSLLAGSGTATAVFKSNSSGLFTVKINDVNAGDRYLWVRSGGHQQLFVKARDGIQQLTFA